MNTNYLEDCKKKKKSNLKDACYVLPSKGKTKKALVTMYAIVYLLTICAFWPLSGKLGRGNKLLHAFSCVVFWGFFFAYINFNLPELLLILKNRMREKSTV